MYWINQCNNKKLENVRNEQGPDLYAFIGFIGPDDDDDDDDLNWLLILIFDY